MVSRATTLDMSENPLHTALRLDTLEARFAQQERVVAELNEVVTAQWDLIESLQRQIQKLREEFEDFDLPRDGQEPPPPHY
jgi:uncharacterized coiled-coil protein SlyX